MTVKAGQLVLAGERVITGTITRVRTSQGGTTDYKIDVETVEGHDANSVEGSVWVKRQKLVKGRHWQRSRSASRCGARRDVSELKIILRTICGVVAP